MNVFENGRLNVNTETTQKSLFVRGLVEMMIIVTVTVTVFISKGHGHSIYFSSREKVTVTAFISAAEKRSQSQCLFQQHRKVQDLTQFSPPGLEPYADPFIRQYNFYYMCAHHEAELQVLRK